MSADLACEQPGAAPEPAQQAQTVLMSLAVLADDPPPSWPGQPPGRSATDGRRRAAPPAAWASLGIAAGWPLALILALQTALSLRLTWSDSASVGEAQALWIGRLELGHWLHSGADPGGPLSATGSYLSGAPALYPQVGAMASGVGGLAAARLLSLCLMLGATIALHGVTRRVSDRRSAFFAAALFAGLAGTAFAGSIASNGAMSLSLVTLAAWLGIRAAQCAGRVQAALAGCAGAALALANATAYSSGPADLVVLAVTTPAIWRSCGRAAAGRGAALMSAALGILLGAGLAAGGRTEWHDALAALAGRAAASSPLGPAPAGGKWLAAVAVLAVVGALVKATARQGWQVTAMSAILAAASALALLGQGPAGAWFACVIAGYAVASLARAVPRAKSAAAFGVGLGLVVLAAVPGIPWAAQQFGWPQAAPMTATMAAVLTRHDGPILADDSGDLLRYYLGQDLARRLIVGTAPLSDNNPAAGGRRGGLAAYRDAIRRHYFGVIMLSLGRSALADQLERTIVLAGYRRVAALPYAAGGPDPATRLDGSWNIWVRAGRP